MKIVAIFVTYFPNDSFRDVYDSLNMQVDHCIIIDNTPQMYVPALIDYKDNVTYLHKNYGIAYAQNKGIEYARQMGFDYVVLSDQDTIYPPDYIFGMIRCYSDALKQVPLISAINPLYFNCTKNSYENIAVDITRTKKPNLCKNYNVAHHSISSGSIIPIYVFDKIGLMNSDLFIDYVDFDWFWRGNALGFSNICASHVIVNHKLGDKSKCLLNRKVTIRNSIRNYYMIRNGVYLALYSDYMTPLERFVFLFRQIALFSGVILIENNRIHNVKMMIRAICHALTKKLGEMK